MSFEFARITRLLAIGIILIAIASIGFCCAYLREIFYRQYGPFWDAVSYDDQLASVMLAVRAGNPFEAVALIYRSTVALPWFEGMLLALFVAPSRAVSVWLQVSWIAVSALAAHGYFRRVTRYPPLHSACCAVLFFTVACTFYWNGGVADFRLDYLQYTMFGLSCLVYLLAQAEGQLDYWVLWGLVLGLTALARATAPVFAVLTFGPFFLVDLWRSRAAPGGVLLRYGFGGAACVLVCGWYFATNFSRLYFYYVDWNWTANAKLPLSVSAGFAFLVVDNIGLVSGLAGLALFGLNLACGHLASQRGRWNLRALWCGLAPLVWLIGSGAQPYASVCQIAMFGIMLFLFAPMLRPAKPAAGWVQTSAAAVAVIITFFSGALSGWEKASDTTGRYTELGTAPSLASVTRVTRCLSDDVAAGPAGARRYAVLYTGLINSEVVTNSLLFDAHWPAELLSDGELSFHIGAASLAMSNFRVDRIVTPVQWAMVEGADDAQRIEWIARKLAGTADYIIAPDPGAGPLPQGATIDRFAAAITARIAARVALVPVCQDIAIGRGEFASIYRNMSLQQATVDGGESPRPAGDPISR